MANDEPKAFVDVNVFLDVLQIRKNWESSLKVISFVRQKKVTGYVSALTVAILYFLRSRDGFSDNQSRRDVGDSISGFEILGLDGKHVMAALSDKRFNDFEDALQFYSAKGVANAILTRNKRDFSSVSGDMEILTPEEFLKKYSD
ncbi:MAG: PIN domain-containing protein [Thaumarchaeota archaeon]|nr:PIN domain-containing protein [Nitrososphaerota archaeon]